MEECNKYRERGVTERFDDPDGGVSRILWPTQMQDLIQPEHLWETVN